MYILVLYSEFNTNYKFTAKELDNEYSYTYFGARYYDSELSGWLSVDPMSDKYPSLSPYCYTANNPIILIDPDGRAWKPTTSDDKPNGYVWVPEGIYEAKVGLHNGNYTALRMGDVGTTDFSNNRIELGTENPAYSDGRTYATGINIHKAGKKNFTGVDMYRKPVSAGCILIDINNWSSFIGHFNNDAQKNNTVSVSISRTYRKPLNYNWTTPVFDPPINNNMIDNTRVVIPGL
ncbi:MAG TPA: RHS repeat-associated core domain-containing protein [Bacteroidales bacterium]|nr:RHS repeat-associated core domain-containing protein [Bacteroidales bacterium]